MKCARKPRVTVKLDADDVKGSVKVFDLTRQQKDRAPKTRVRKGKTVRRDPGSVTGIVLHQTAVTFGVADYQISLAGGDREMAKRRRALGIAAHAVAFRSGDLVLPNHVLSYVYHAGPLNRSTVGLEAEGIYPGLMDNPKTTPREDVLTLWRHKRATKLDPITIATARRGVVVMRDEVARAGGHLQYIYAHRQSSRTRRSDPGEQLWREVGEWAVEKLGLKAPRWQTFGSGKPIPEQWSLLGRGKY